MGLSKDIFITSCNIRAIFRQEIKFKSRWRLLFNYAKIAFRYHVLVKLLGASIRREKVLGYVVRFKSYETFYSLFSDIFIQREYDFIADSDSPLIIDCGANFGMSILYFKNRYPRARIICFEPHRETFALLEDNIRANNLADIELHNAAVFTQKGSRVLYSDADKRNVTGMSLIPRLAEKNMRLDEETVSTVTLSSIIKEPVDFLKMDVEGVEAEVLSELKDKSKLELICRMACEYHYSVRLKNNRLSRLLALLEDDGFRYMVYAPEGLSFESRKDKPYNMLLYAYR